jgi:hypothetical protein
MSSRSDASTFVKGVKLGFVGTSEEIAKQIEAAGTTIKQPLGSSRRP